MSVIIYKHLIILERTSDLIWYFKSISNIGFDKPNPFEYNNIYDKVIICFSKKITEQITHITTSYIPIEVFIDNYIIGHILILIDNNYMKIYKNSLNMYSVFSKICFIELREFINILFDYNTNQPNDVYILWEKELLNEQTIKIAKKIFLYENNILLNITKENCKKFNNNINDIYDNLLVDEYNNIKEFNNSNTNIINTNNNDTPKISFGFNSGLTNNDTPKSSFGFNTGLTNNDISKSNFEFNTGITNNKFGFKRNR